MPAALAPETPSEATIAEVSTAPVAERPDVKQVSWRAARTSSEQTHPTNPASPEPAEVELGPGDVVRIPEPTEKEVDEDRYDGLGTLRPVISRRRDAPRYALVDGEGDVLTFVTPSPGVNLQPYVGQRIAVIGTRGYMPEFKRPHVTAARITPLR